LTFVKGELEQENRLFLNNIAAHGNPQKGPQVKSALSSEEGTCGSAAFLNNSFTTFGFSPPPGRGK
jgi:hypothetical protein